MKQFTGVMFLQVSQVNQDLIVTGFTCQELRDSASVHLFFLPPVRLYAVIFAEKS
jgi:hypothetical protein